MDSRFGFKDFEQVRLKAITPIQIGNRTIEAGETIALFDKVQIAQMAEEVKRVSANGGFDNRPHVFWTTTKDERLDFSQGVFSSEQFALMINARLIEIAPDSAILITNEESLESDENGSFELKEIPVRLWVYNKETGEKISSYTIDGKSVTIADAYTDVIAIYTYEYINGAKEYRIGERLLNGFVELEGRTRVKDDMCGRVTTGIFKVPKLRLMSNLSIMLGPQAVPVVGNFSAMAVPVGPRGNTYVSEFFVLNDDIESDL